MLKELTKPSVVEHIRHPVFERYGVEVSVKRDDLIHPIISGNKWRKLKLNLERCVKEKYKGILTFGGAWSNHIAATAVLGKLAGIKTVGIIRGDELRSDANPILKLARDSGMELIFVQRSEYDLRGDQKYLEQLKKKLGNLLFVPEGGANYEGVLGAVEIVNELEESYDYILLPCGTGTTAAGVLLGSSGTKVIGISVLKGGDFLLVEIERLLSECGLTTSDIKELLRDFHLVSDYHFGGYGQFDETLISWINEFYKETAIPSDQIYTGKLFYGLVDMVKKSAFPLNSKILVIHTGGLLGTLSVENQLDFKVTY